MSCNGCEEKNLIIVLEASDGTKYIQVFHNILSDIEEFDYSDAKLQELKTQHPTYEECVHFLDLSV
jgi:hypothetical protein|tara:strand:- start:368 stop:565 length:198 start_codon:yes stop_codon:yes gene_type:complete